MRAPFTAARLRWGAPIWERVGDGWERGYIRRLGKSAGEVLDELEAAGGSLELNELAERVGCKRPRDLRRRAVAKLEEAGVVECSAGRVSLRVDWLESLERERHRAGEHEAFRRDMRKYAREREAWRSRHQRPPDRGPTEMQMDENRHQKERERERVAELQRQKKKLSETRYRALMEMLHAGGRVGTVRGPGRLWNVRTGDVGVVLDAEPRRVSWMEPDQITGEMIA